ncbi:plakophilin-3 isoform X2 [Tachysurus ichikawai]
MSTSEGLFFSALQPHTAVSTYAVPNDRELTADRQPREKRVQQQVQQRLAEKASSEYSGISMKRYSSQGTGINSKTVMLNGSRKTNPRSHQGTGGFSSRSAVEMGTQRKVSLGTPMPAVVGNPYRYYDGSYNGGHHIGQVNRVEQEVMQGQPSPSGNWVTQEGMTSSEHRSYYGHSPLPSVSPMRRSLSGTLVHDAPGRGWKEAELAHQYSSKGPAHRTLMRMNNRQTQQQRMGSNTIQWQQASAGGSTMMAGGQYPGMIRRTGSVHSLKSVGQGMDVCDALASGRDISGGIHSLDMTTAVSYLSSADVAMHMLGAAYIQHQCYHSNDAKDLVRNLKGIPALVQLYCSENQEVQRYATGATRNLIYENMDNKAALIEAGGISKLVSALREPDDELRKNVTGILWNLSSKDSLKEKLARESLAELTERVLIPLSGGGESAVIQQSQSEMDIFYNTTGCLRYTHRQFIALQCKATKVVNILVPKLPSDGHQKEPSSDVVVNICGILNNLVMASSLAARDVTYFDGVPKLVGIKTSHDNSPGKVKAAKAASTVLCNMFQYSKLHKNYKQKGFTRRDFTDTF